MFIDGEIANFAISFLIFWMSNYKGIKYFVTGLDLIFLLYKNK